MFILKKIVAPLLFPVPLCLEILLVGLILLWFTRRQKTGRIVVSIGVILLAVFGCGLMSNTLLGRLEHEYPPLLSLDDVSNVKWVVVLGGGQISNPQLPVTNRLSGASLARLVEGIRLHNLLGRSKLILSGGGASDTIPEAKVLADVAVALGIAGENLVLESLSRDTKDEARLIQKIVGNDRFILVTSGSHMPRSMAMFRKTGMQPIPAPTDYYVKQQRGMSPGMFFPSSGGLRKTERAVYEYLGLTWAKLKGQI